MKQTFNAIVVAFTHDAANPQKRREKKNCYQMWNAFAMWKCSTNSKSVKDNTFYKILCTSECVCVSVLHIAVSLETLNYSIHEIGSFYHIVCYTHSHCKYCWFLSTTHLCHKLNGLLYRVSECFYTYIYASIVSVYLSVYESDSTFLNI